jgi:predicted HicB family RNase H-like nuclease
LSIKAGEDYDTRVSVPLELEDELMFELMKMAHEQDLTLNEFVEQLLRRVIEEEDLRRELEELSLK